MFDDNLSNGRVNFNGVEATTYHVGQNAKANTFTGIIVNDNLDGGVETRLKNIAVYWIIKVK